MSLMIIDMKDFSFAPYGRDETHGPDNGEAFRSRFLEPAFKAPGVSRVVVKLDSIGSCAEYDSSFLDEAFGGLVSKSGIPVEEILRKLQISSSRRDYHMEILTHIERAGLGI